MAFEILRNSNFVNVGSYRTGTPEEGEQISTDRQQNQHAVEIQAGCRGSGQGQRWLERAGWKAGDSCEPRTPPPSHSGPPTPRLPSKHEDHTPETSSYLGTKVLQSQGFILKVSLPTPTFLLWTFSNTKKIWNNFTMNTCLFISQILPFTFYEACFSTCPLIYPFICLPLYPSVHLIFDAFPSCRHQFTSS